MRFALLFLAACDGPSEAPPPPETTNLATSGIGVKLDVTSNGAAILLDATVIASNGTPLELGPADVFSASAPDAPEKALGRYAAGQYALVMPSQSQTLSFSLLRNGKSVSTTMLTLPSAFTIAAPSAPTRAMGLPLTWAPGVPGEQLTLTITGPCLPGMRLVRQPDPLGGGFTVQGADFSAATGACKLAIDLERAGAMPSALLGLASVGGAKLVQTRTLEIVTQP
jgi:hypothetical protein